MAQQLRPQDHDDPGVPPSNLQAEEQLLSALLIQPFETVPKVTGTIQVRDFYKPAHGLIFEAMMELVEEGVRPDVVCVAEKLREKGLLTHIGGPATLVNIQASMSGYASNAERYVSIITNASRRRDLLAAAGEIAELARDQHESAVGAARALELVQKVVDDTNKRVHLRTMDEMLDDYLNVLEARQEGEGLGISTGWTDLDNITQGMREGELIVVGARPAVGKSTFAGNLALNVIEQGRKVLLVSVEMAETEIMERLMASTARVDLRRLRGGDLDPVHWERLHEASGRLSGRPLTILDDPNATVADVRSCALRTGAELVIVDYTQLMKTEERRGGTREREVADLTGSFKRLARELRCPVVALSQVKRDADDRRPELGDMAESSSFEKNANVVIGLYREELVSGGAPGIIEVIVIKSRNTKTGTARLAYIGHYQKISNMAQVEQAPERAYDGWRN